MIATQGQNKLRADALEIWSAGVNAVTPRVLFQTKVRVEDDFLQIDDWEVDLSSTRRIVVIGAGKASAAMAQEFLARVSAGASGALLGRLQCEGWVNCPAGTFDPHGAELHLNSGGGIVRLFAARPGGENLPTENAILGTQRILDLVAGCGPEDLVVCMLSGGGSALLAAPLEGVSLADKQAVARVLAAAGADIEQLNAVRRCLSRVKAGGLARACTAGRMVSVVISDVLGDPLQTIASGPTLACQPPCPAAALDVLNALGLLEHAELASVIEYLRKQNVTPAAGPISTASPKVKNRDLAAPAGDCQADHVILANNADAVDAAGVKAVELGYRYVMQSARAPEGDVMKLARTATAASLQLLSQNEVDCWISGGEPTVVLPSPSGKGGRNQQLALAVLDELADGGWPLNLASPRRLAFVAGGTDGEDGPTDAAGAFFDALVYGDAQAVGLDPKAYLASADAYKYFDQAGGLLKTGPTGTNVCDLRVALVG